MPRKRQTHFTNAFERKRSGGFALVGFLTMMPALLAIFLATASMALLVREFTRTQTVCKNHLFNMQDDISKQLNKLINLNPKALKLRLQYKRAKKQFLMAAASGNPVRIAMAEARLVAIELERSVLDTQQNNIITQANSISHSSTIKLRHELKQQQIEVELKSLAIRPDILGDLAPAYITLPNFRQKQTVHAQYFWKMPSWIKNQETEFFFACAASIEKRSDFYRATLVEGT